MFKLFIDLFCNFVYANLICPEMKNVNIKVSDETAEAIKNMSDLRKKELLASIESWVRPKRTLEQIMKDISDQAQKNGLTPEILDELLKEE